MTTKSEILIMIFAFVAVTSLMVWATTGVTTVSEFLALGQADSHNSVEQQLGECQEENRRLREELANAPTSCEIPPELMDCLRNRE